MMGLKNSHAIPCRPLQNGVFWMTPGNEYGSKHLLCPIWDSWPLNQVAWAEEIVDKVMLDGHQYYHISVEDLCKIIQPEIEALCTSWQTAKKKFIDDQKEDGDKKRKAKNTRKNL